jgi:D-amino-acid dehydrogenase
MVYERGYHQHYAMASSVPLKRPFHDAQGGYVLSPMGDQVRLTSGVEFTPRDAPAQTAQLEQAEANARQSIALGQPLKPQAWLGSRPTLPDSRPVIGPSGRHPGLWLAFGHQHIGLSTGAGTGELLADLLSQQPARINPLPFAAHRFGL